MSSSTTSATLVKPNNPAQAKQYFEDKMQFTTGPVELERMMKQRQDITVIDVRAAEDYQKGHIPGAINIPKEQWDRPNGLSKDKQNILYCYSQVCHLAATAAVKFAGAGYPVMELEGGWETWQEHELPVKTGNTP
jgi:rhodanese-related sulfurtransferase